MSTALQNFVFESNRIEGITREPTDAEIKAHSALLAKDELGRDDLREFVWRIAAARLRECSGMDVVVGSHRPPPGGPSIGVELHNLLVEINVGDLSPYEAHIRYETLHPFMDGNGRSGRAVWAWQMQRDGLDPFALPFLHRWYYDSLDVRRT